MSAVAQIIGARVIAGGRVQAILRELPPPSIPSGFRVIERVDGMSELLDASGRKCGLFSAKHLAEGTAELLNR
jgi:hypothetical protein